MKDNPLLFLILLGLIVWFVWFQFKNTEKKKERDVQVARKQQATRMEREEWARREAEEAERQRRAAESAAWRVEVAEDRRQRDAEKEKARRQLQQERAAQLEQERRDRQAAEAEAQRRAEAERARQREAEENARRLAEEERARQRGQADAARNLVEDERTSIRAAPIAGDIHHAMREFLSNNQFFGEDHSPLAYVGYKVGRTNGLPVQERRRRLRACFQIKIPPQLAAKYQAWGPPVTYQRFTSMRQHITMLADMRRARPSYEVAVSDWEADEEWLKTEYGGLAERLRRVGIG
jgi:hypothetical protein